MRLLTLFLVLLVAFSGCDSVSDDIVPLDDILLVDLVDGGLTLRVETESTRGCGTPIVYETRVTPDVLTLSVDGLAARSGSPCRAITTSTLYVSLLPGPRSGWVIQIGHRGETDAYEVFIEEKGGGDRAWGLDPVRESVTRLRQSEPGS